MVKGYNVSVDKGGKRTNIWINPISDERRARSEYKKWENLQKNTQTNPKPQLFAVGHDGTIAVIEQSN